MHGHSHSHGLGPCHSHHGHSTGHQHHSGHGHSPGPTDPHRVNSHSAYVIDAPMSDSPSRPKSQEPLTSFKTIKPFRSSSLKPVVKELWKLVQRREAASLVVVGLINVAATAFLLYLSSSTKSMSLSAFSYVTVFDSFALLTCFLSLWVERQSPSPAYSFGHKRTQVLAVFSATILAQLGALFSVKESIERLFDSSHVVIHSGEMVIGAVVAFLLHLIVTHFHCANYALFNHVIEAASSSWLQEQVADLSQSLCHFMPGLSRALLPRVNPLILIGWSGFGLVLLSDLLLDLDNSHSVDTWAAIVFSVIFFGTMFPMSTYAGKILLQTIPPHVIGQLDKCLREASTLDGVLEFRHEHFWTVSFGSLAGSVHVRIRRDANEQMVLAHVHDRLQAVVSDLTIQAFKDDWATRVGVAASSRTGVHFVPGASTAHGLGSGSNSPFTIGGGASLPLVRGGAGGVGQTGHPALPQSTHSSASGNFNIFAGSDLSNPTSRFGSTTNIRNSATKTSHHVVDVGGGGGGGAGFSSGSWLGNTSTPVKEDSPLPLDLKPPSDISHIVGLGGGAGGGMILGGTRDASRNGSHHQKLNFPTSVISPIKKT